MFFSLAGKELGDLPKSIQSHRDLEIGRSKSTALEGSRVRSSRKFPDLLLLSMISEISMIDSGVMELPLPFPQNRLEADG